jgi:hypothetical protein
VTLPAAGSPGFELQVDVDHVLRGQGMDAGLIRARRPALVLLAERAISEGMPLVRPQVRQRTLRVDGLRDQCLELEGGFTLSGPLVARHFARASQVALVVCTIGSQLEERMAQVVEDDPAFALALDGFGTAAAETLATSACAQFSERAAGGLCATAPIGPGLPDWPVDEGQPELFAALQLDPAIVRLQPGGIMAPRKSISFAIGFGVQPVSGDLSNSACSLCYLSATCPWPGLRSLSELN